MGTRLYFAVGLLVLAVAALFLLPSQGFTDVPPFANSQLTVTDGVMLHYRTWAPQEAPQGTVLMVHGLGGSTFSWRYAAPALVEAGYAVVAVDLPGFGYSDRARRIDHSQQARAGYLWQLLDSLPQSLRPADDETWHLMGHSMGGGTITAMAHQRPQQTAALIYAAGAVYNQPPRAAAFLLRIPILDRIIAQIFQTFFITERRITSTLASAYGRPPEPSEVAGYLTTLRTSGTARSLLDITTSQGPPVSDYLANLQIPALLLWGAADTWVPVAQGERMAADLPQAVLETHPEAAHCPMETHPQWYNQQVLNFLNHLPSP